MITATGVGSRRAACHRPSSKRTSIGWLKAADTCSEVIASAAGPAETTLPSASSSAWVVDDGSSSRWCVTRTDATSGCVSESRSMDSSSCSRAAMSSPVDGSSSRISRGSQISARAMSTRPRSPWDSTFHRGPALPSRPSDAISASARPASSAVGRQRGAVSMVPVRPVSTMSRTVSGERSGWRGFTCPIARRSACSSTRPSCCPSTRTVPERGVGDRAAEAEQRALARAVRPEHGPVLARAHREADAADDLVAVSAVRHVRELKHWRGCERLHIHQDGRYLPTRRKDHGSNGHNRRSRAARQGTGGGMAGAASLVKVQRVAFPGGSSDDP